MHRILLLLLLAAPVWLRGEVNLAATAEIAASSHLGNLRAEFLADGQRGRQSAGTYWNDGTRRQGGDTIRLTWQQPQPVQEVRVLAPLMDRSGPYQLPGIEICLLRTGTPVATASNLALFAASALATCRDPALKMASPVAADEIRITFGTGNPDGWNFCGEVVVLGPGEGPDLPEELAAQDGKVPIMTYAESVQWLEDKARELVRTSLQTMTNGTHAFPPQVGLGYNAFWLRDYSYMLETCADAFSDAELAAACRLFVRSLGPDGAGVDCVRYSGEPIYKPGFGTMGRLSVADGGPFTVNVAWATWRQTHDAALLAEVLPGLVRTMQAVPRNPATGLVHITPGEPQERCPYGFTDTIGKQGDVLFCSLLDIQASRRIAELCQVIGEDSKPWQERAEAGVAAVRKVFWDEELGLFRAATVQCREPDLWGSSFAVYLEVATPAQAQRIATYCRDHYAEICQHGQFRHLPGGVYWERGCKPDTYQNGAFWATPTGWFVHTLALVDPALARQTVIALVQDFRSRGVCEWVIGDRIQLPNYVASATLPLQGIRGLAGK